MDTRAITDEAIILRGRDYREADRLLVVLTRKQGKISALAKGVRKTNSSLKAVTQLFSVSTLTFSHSKGLKLVTQGQSIESMRLLREDLDKIAYASYIAEIVDMVLEEGKANEQVYVLVFTVLTLLQAADDPYMIMRFFDLRMLAVLGYRPYLDSCVSCKRGLHNGKFALSAARGGIICESCLGLYNASPVSVGAVRTMAKILDSDLRRLFNLKITKSMREEIDTAIANYMDYYLEKAPKARAVLAQYTGLSTK
ncbi:MAG: DNA repair protein RecO [Clostridia bacterium]|jgi:DNA repair protein RecO (recombination protein O)|nr:DNA repair protein RecO [Clostridia bacterium]MDD4572491.1 DNA repair protein RecO [Clostridia bacterium]